jgi:hypothetical protein
MMTVPSSVREYSMIHRRRRASGNRGKSTENIMKIEFNWFQSVVENDRVCL